MKRLFIGMLSACISLIAVCQYRSEVWSPDNGDGTYTNPVLYADYSDPDICVVGDDYYLTASSFNCIPGLPILHSVDLINWSIVGHALQEQQPSQKFDFPAHGDGVWAPSIRHHEGRFYIYWGDPDRGILMVHSRDARGPWSDPVCVVEGQGLIDPCPLWDDDGRCYLVNGWAASRCGFNSVLTVRQLSADGTHAIGLPRIVFDGGQENHTTEGPKMYKRDGWYWILCPAGGVESGWQLAMRSRSPYGPYEWRRVMWQGRTDINGPHQGGWVHTPEGEDWFLHFNDKGAYGRVVYLQPVDWSSGWPVMGNQGEPYARFRKPKVASHVNPVISNPQESDEMNDGTLGLQWQWSANYQQTFGMPTSDGHFRLYNYDADDKTLWQVPNLLLQKLPAPDFVATSKVRIAAKEEGQSSGLVMMGRDYSALLIERQGDDFVLKYLTCIGADKGKTEQSSVIRHLTPTHRDDPTYAPAIFIDIYLRLSVNHGQCTFSYSLDSKHYAQAASPFTMKEGKWIGAKMGFVSICHHRIKNRGWMDVDWWRVSR